MIAHPKKELLVLIVTKKRSSLKPEKVTNRYFYQRTCGDTTCLLVG